MSPDQPPVTPLGLAFALPALAEALPDEERATRLHVEGDRCEVDGELFFVRGRLQLPLAEASDVFEWTVWASLGGAAYVQLCEALESPDAELPKPLPARMATRLPHYPETLDLRLRLHPQPGALPLLVVENEGHPLAWEQRDGISVERLREFAQTIRHGHAH